VTLTPVPLAPLSIGYVPSRECLPGNRWLARFTITVGGGLGSYTYYRDSTQIHGPTQDTSFAYSLEANVGSGVIGSFAVTSGEDRAAVNFQVASPVCATPTTPVPPMPTLLPPTPTATWVSPLPTPIP
jgi:hypothetical protein